MSLNGLDYTKQLAKDREYFQDANKKLADATEKRIKASEERAEHIMTKQRDNFIEDRAELESHYQNNLNNLKEKTNLSIKENAKDFNEKLTKERENFTSESKKNEHEFNKRLSDIKSSYEKAFNSETDRNGKLEKINQQKYKRNMSQQKESFDNKIKEYEDKIKGTGAEIAAETNKETQQLVRRHENEMAKVYKDTAESLTKLKDRINYDNKQQKAAHVAEMGQQKKYSDDRIKSAEKKFERHARDLNLEFSKKNEEILKRQASNTLKTNREHNEQLSGLRREYNDHLRSIENEKRRRDNGDGEYAEFTKRQQGDIEKEVYEKRIANLNNDLIEVKKNYQIRLDQDQKKLSDSFQKETSENIAKFDKKMNLANAEKIIRLAEARDKNQVELHNREHQNRLNQLTFESQLMTQKRNSSERINKLKESFNKSMVDLEEKHRSNLDVLTKTANADKNDFTKKMQVRRAEEVYELKRAFGKMMDATVQDYEQRLAVFQKENDYIKQTMELRIQNILEKTENQIESQRNLFEDRRKADLKGKQLVMDERENQLKRNMSQLNLNFQKKIDKLQIENEARLKLITDDYETKLRDTRATMNKELAQKDSGHQVELARIKNTYEDEKAKIVSGYETKIETLKNTHREQLDNLNSYKRLS